MAQLSNIIRVAYIGGITKMTIVQDTLVTVGLVLYHSACKFSYKLGFNYFLENFPQWTSFNQSVQSFKFENYFPVIAEN